MTTGLAESIIQLTGTLSFVFVLLNFIWTVRHKSKFEQHTIIIAATLVLYQGLHFLLQAFYAATLIASDLDVVAIICYFVIIDVFIMVLAFLNSFYNCRVKIKL